FTITSSKRNVKCVTAGPPQQGTNDERQARLKKTQLAVKKITCQTHKPVATGYFGKPHRSGGGGEQRGAVEFPWKAFLRPN
ncbi:hypothetical protein GWI33_023119, partial [Rhynchophorus ferrugineus]